MSQPHSTENMFDTVRASLPSLSPKMTTIATYAIENPDDFIRRTSKDLCRILNTSEPTLIRFCKQYGKAGLSEFRIDLALSLVAEKLGEAGTIEPRVSDRRRLNAGRKSVIAKAAIELIRDDSALLLDNGSTAESFAAELGNLPPLTLMTTGLSVAQTALQHEKHNVIVTGGTVRGVSQCMTGSMVREALKDMTFDTFIMGADSISVSRGVSTFLEEEAQNTRIMMQAARRTIILADGSKFEKPTLHHICDLASVDLIVTDLSPEAEITQALRDAGAKLHLV